MDMEKKEEEVEGYLGQELRMEGGGEQKNTRNIEINKQGDEDQGKSDDEGEDPLGQELLRELKKQLSDDFNDADSAVNLESDVGAEPEFDGGDSAVDVEAKMDDEDVDVEDENTQWSFEGVPADYNKPQEGSIWYGIPEPGPVSSRRGVHPMKAAEQEQAIADLKAKIEKIDAIHPPPPPKQAVSPPPPPKQTVNKLVNVNITPTAKATKTKRPAQISNTLSKPAKRQKTLNSYKFNVNKLNHIPASIEEAMSHLNLLGSPLEASLSVVIRHARDYFAKYGEQDKDALIRELLLKEAAWKKSNREHLKDMDMFLTRRGMFSTGSVEVPKDVLGIEMPKDVVKVEDESEDDVVVKVEEEC